LNGGFGTASGSYYRLTVMGIGTVACGKNTGEDLTFVI
jgi:hypothetical protein